MALRKVAQATPGGAASGPGVTDSAEWPLILEHLTTEKYEDGSPREKSCLIVVADATGWRVCLSDKDNGRTMWKTASDVLAALQCIEQALAEDDPSQWRQSYGKSPRGKGKRG